MSSFQPLSAFIAAGELRRAKGPVAIILVDDRAVIDATLAHHIKIGFRTILLLSPRDLGKSATHERAVVHNLGFDTATRSNAHVDAINRVIAAVPEDTWLYYCYNAEFLFFPFSESRSVGEMLAFHAEERRRAMLTYVIDLYAPDLATSPDAVDLGRAMLDKTGYFALARRGTDGNPADRQLDFHGGLRWRFEEHTPPNRRRIDRIGLFRSRKGLRLLADHRFNDAEYNTYSCPWHHNLTAAIMSFRVAKALVRNPGSRAVIGDFTWHNSIPFSWKSQQLMELGLIEPGQWF